MESGGTTGGKKTMKKTLRYLISSACSVIQSTIPAFRFSSIVVRATTSISMALGARWVWISTVRLSSLTMFDHRWQ